MGLSGGGAGAMRKAVRIECKSAAKPSGGIHAPPQLTPRWVQPVTGCHWSDPRLSQRCAPVCAHVCICRPMYTSLQQIPNPFFAYPRGNDGASAAPRISAPQVHHRPPS